MTITVFVVALLAALRLTRLVTEDTITAPFRAFLARRAAIEGRIGHAFMWLVQLTECPWCTGFWVSSAITAAAIASGGAGWFLYPALALAMSYLLGVVATVVYTVEEFQPQRYDR